MLRKLSIVELRSLHTHRANPVYVTSTEKRWILEHIQGCWSWRWKLKERYKHKVKANLGESRKACAAH